MTPRATPKYAVSTSRPTGTRTRNRRGEGGRLREDILAAATALLDELGTEDAVTLRAVARRAGITAPSIYPHFPDRQAILLAVVTDAFADLTTRLGDAAGAGERDTAEPVARLRAVCDAYLDFAGDLPKVYRLMFGGVWNAEQAMQSGSVSADQVTGLGGEALGLLTTCLHDCVVAGHSTSTDPASDSVALWVGLHGLASQRSASPAFPWPADIQDRIIRSLARLGPGTAS
jgi:AcrR family transcriptional regulator